ncbi:hypothetical protein QE152_g35779 [Popillia japonica]|uniref:Uncharacterized protein n=1 Tax=Popillia japonica TaxID=7064 RepID=A0AAW1IFB3_POPJA
MPADSRDLRITRSTAEEEALIKKIVEKVLCSDLLKKELIETIRSEIVSELKEQVKALTNKVVSLEVELKSARLETMKAVNDLKSN